MEINKQQFITSKLTNFISFVSNLEPKVNKNVISLLENLQLNFSNLIIFINSMCINYPYNKENLAPLLKNMDIDMNLYSDEEKDKLVKYVNMFCSIYKM